MERSSLIPLRETAEKAYFNQRGGYYASAIGIARLRLILGDPQGALDALDNAADRSHQMHYDALIVDGYSREDIERFIGPRERSEPRKKVGDGVG